MATTICPYCDSEVSEKEIETEDGCCPECGAMLSVSSLYMDDDDEYDPYDDLDDEDDMDDGIFDDEDIDFDEEFDEEFDEDFDDFDDDFKDKI